MSSVSTNSPIPAVIRETLDRMRGIITRYILLQTVFVTAICGFLIFWLTGLIDYFPVMMGASESPLWARSLMLVGFFASTLYLLYRVGLRKWLVEWRDSSLALLIERRFPQLRHALITTVQASQRRVDHASLIELTDPKLLAATQQAAMEGVEQIDLDAVMRWKPLQLQAGILGGIVAVSLLLTLWHPAWTFHWAKRFFGLSNDAWPRMCRLNVEGIEIEVPRFSGETETQRYLRPFVDRSITIPRGQSVRLLVAADLSAPQVPEACMLSYRSADNRHGKTSLRRLNPIDSRRLPFMLEGPPMDSIDQAYSLSLQGGDVRIAGLRLEVIEAPQLNDLQLEVRYPSYLRRRTTSLWLDETIPYRTGLRLPQGSHVTLRGKSNMPLDRCEVRVTRQGGDGPAASDMFTAVGEGDAFQLDIGAIENSRLLEFRLWESSGHCSTRVQQMVLGILPDELPNVDFVLDGIGSAITDKSILPLQSRVADDHDIASSWLELAVSEEAPKRIPLEVASDGRIQQSIDFRELRERGEMELAAGQTLGLSLFAKDFYDLDSNDRTGRSSPIQLAVVTPNQLLVLLERRELAMRSRMELIISELHQLRELLVKVRQTNRPGSGDAQGPGSAPSTDDSDAISRDKLQVLRAQQATSQMEKSDGELAGVETEIGQIRQELIHNRIDSQDRQDRLENRVRLPIQRVRSDRVTETMRRLKDLEKGLAGGPVDDASVAAALDALGTTLTALEAILQDMIDIQDFNEVVDMVRSMIEDQNQLIDRTKTEQKKRVLDMFK